MGSRALLASDISSGRTSWTLGKDGRGKETKLV